MKRYGFDFHLHSCLSPCADDDNTPNNLCGMSMLAGLSLIALTDHNSCGNCPAFFEAAARLGLVPVAGMELTTAEEIHMVCLFETLPDAMAFDRTVASARLRVQNRPDLFGRQLLTDGEDRPLGEEPFVLSYATSLSVSDACTLVAANRGVCYPAHIDRPANGMLAVLGAVPPEYGFRYAELTRLSVADELRAGHPELCGLRFLTGSDAHALTTVRDAEQFCTLDGEEPEAVRRALFQKLREGTL